MKNENIFKSIQYEIRGRSIYSLVSEQLNVLLQIDLDQKRYISMPYWHLFSLLRWTIIYSSGKIILPDSNRIHIISLLNLINELEDLHQKERLSEKKTWSEIFHLIANQQFEQQIPVDKYTFARQYCFYMDSGEDSLFDKLLLQILGIPISEFIKLSLITYLYINFDQIEQKEQNYNGRLNNDYFQVIKKLLAWNFADNYINSLTIDLNNLEESKKRIKSLSKINNPTLQLFEPYKLSLFPIIKIKNEYRIIHRNLFNVNFRNYLYDVLKSTYKGDFTQIIGKRVENYVKKGLDELRIKYLNEKEIEEKVGIKSKLIDFLLDNEVMIECKGIELPSLPSVAPTSDNISKYLKDSILKALKDQFTAVANKLCFSKKAICIIITLKELNLGFGKNTFENLISDPSDRKNFQKYLDPQRIFILPLEEWDILLNTCKVNSLKINDVLDPVIDLDSINRKKFISMHIFEKYGRNNFELNYLNEAYKRIKL
ncbi:MAG: hypothetical protein SFU99_16020 [Saprospiraceae bacterium]|nr:hypothetical protein [Saprospiraceae bacterium]